MFGYKGVYYIGEIESKVAPIIDEFFANNGPERFLTWIKDNDIRVLDWWDYQKHDDNYEAVPFHHFTKLFSEKERLSHVWPGWRDGGQHSFTYLLIPKEMALQILFLGYVA